MRKLHGFLVTTFLLFGIGFAAVAQENMIWDERESMDPTIPGQGRAVDHDSAGRVIVLSTIARSDHDDLALTVFLSDGSLDTSWGTDGVLVYDGGADEEAYDVLVDDNDAIVVLASTSNGGDRDLLLLRFTSAGTLDNVFDTDGVQTWDGGNDDVPGRLALDAFDNYFVTVTSGNGVDTDGVVLKYDDTADLDTTFDGDGVLVFDDGDDETANGLFVTTSDDILFCGSMHNGANWDIYAFRVDPGGSPRATFDGDGLVQYDGGFNERAIGVVESSGGDVFVAGNVDSGPGGIGEGLFLGYTAIGQLDTGFSGDGVAIGSSANDSIELRDLAISSTDAMLAVGTADPVDPDAPTVSTGVRVFTSGGVAILSWGYEEFDREAYGASADGGAVFVVGDSEQRDVIGATGTFLRQEVLSGGGDTEWVTAAALDRVHAIQAEFRTAWSLLTSGNEGDTELLVAKYTSNGSLDTTFASSGRLSVDQGGSTAGRALARFNNGDFLAAGRSGTSGDTDALLVAFDENGSLLSSFSGDGLLEVDVAVEDLLHAVFVDSSDRVYVAGESLNVGGTFSDALILKLQSDGTLDTTFSVDGIAQWQPGADAIFTGITADSSQNVYVVGVADNGADTDLVVLKYTDSGVLDATFGTAGLLTIDSGWEDAGFGITQDASGNLLVCGHLGNGADTDLVVYRMDTDGNLDGTFATAGVYTYDDGGNEAGRAIMVDSSDRIVVTGYAPGPRDQDMLLIRLDATGTPDSNFDSDGIRLVNSGFGYDVGFALANAQNFFAGGAYAGTEGWTQRWGHLPQVGASAVAANAVNDDQIDLSWTHDQAFTDGYRIEVSTDNLTYTSKGTVDDSIQVFSITRLDPNTNYFIRIFAFNDIGDSPASAAVQEATLDSLPLTPTNLVITAASTTQLNLGWTDASDNETGFEIYRSTDNTNFTLITTEAADTEAYSDTGLAQGTLYYYRVLAVNTATGGTPATGSGTTDDVLPNAPTNLMAVSYTTQVIELAWTDNSDNEQGFEILRADSGNPAAVVATLAQDVTTYSDQALSSQTQFVYYVRAYNTAGTARSNSVTIVTRHTDSGNSSGCLFASADGSPVSLAALLLFLILGAGMFRRSRHV